MERDSEERPLVIRSYNNAFELQLFGASARSLIFDWASLAIITFAGVLILGQIYPFNLLYAWTIRENWAFIQFIFVPIVLPIFVIGLTKRDGVSFWRYVGISIVYMLSDHVFEPFNEPPLWKRFFKKGD